MPLNLLGVLNVCVHMFSSVSVCVCPNLYFSRLISLSLSECVCVYRYSTTTLSVCGPVPTATQRSEMGIISLPAGLHLVNRVQSIEVNINLKPNKNNTSHHATASPLSPATHTSHTPLKCQLDQRQTLKERDGKQGSWWVAYAAISPRKTLCATNLVLYFFLSMEVMRKYFGDVLCPKVDVLRKSTIYDESYLS